VQPVLRAADEEPAITQRLRAQYAEISQLAGGLAHEIRNPLSTLSLNLDLLLEDFQNPETPRDRRVLQRVERLRHEVQRLFAILENFLRFARVQDLKLEPTDLNAIIDELRDFSEPQAATKGIVIRTRFAPDLPSIRIDRDLFKQALLNLVLNAQHAMPSGGELILTTRREGPCVVLDVIDTGVGMPAEVCARIFDAFFSTRTGGSGLGLPTTRKIVEAHGGVIDVQSEPGKGSQFTIRLLVGGGHWQAGLLQAIDAKGRLEITPETINAARVEEPGLSTRAGAVPAVAPPIHDVSSELATRGGLEVREVESIEFGETRYNLRKPIVGVYVPGEAALWEFRVRECGDQFFGRGETIEEAYNDWGDQIHTTFQLLAGKRPFEMSEDEMARWETLLSLIDVDEYRDRTPVILTETGRVSKGPPGGREVTWWPSDRTEKIGLELVPAHFATYATDQWFEAIVERDRRTWQIRKVQHARPVDPIGPLSEKEHDEFWASIKTIADLPDSNQDWTDP